ncbi:hypothetical protein BDW75DRAFT_237808 [Aspergillus navahoensis]
MPMTGAAITMLWGGSAFFRPYQFSDMWPQIIQPLGDLAIIGEIATAAQENESNPFFGHPVFMAPNMAEWQALFARQSPDSLSNVAKAFNMGFTRPRSSKV